MNTLEQTTQLAIELIKQQKVSDFEISLGKSSGVSTTVRLSNVETLQYHLDTSFNVSVYIGKNKGQATSVDLSKVSLNNAIDPNKLKSLVQRTKDGGAEIVNLLKTGSAFYAPSASIVKMVDAICSDSKTILPTTAYLNGEYGINDLYFGVPAKLGKNGIEEIIEYDLSESEKNDLKQSANAVKETVEAMENLS